MKCLVAVTILFVAWTNVAVAQWQQQRVDTKSDFRGLSVVSPKGRLGQWY